MKISWDKRCDLQLTIGSVEGEKVIEIFKEVIDVFKKHELSYEAAQSILDELKSELHVQARL